MGSQASRVEDCENSIEQLVVPFYMPAGANLVLFRGVCQATRRSCGGQERQIEDGGQPFTYAGSNESA
jgi:hypothetical protein